MKKTRLGEYESNRSGGVIAINLRENGDGISDELVSASLLSAGQDLLLVSRHGQSLRFHADDATLRPTGRATSGVTGMRFRPGDSLLAMGVVDPQWTDEVDTLSGLFLEIKQELPHVGDTAVYEPFRFQVTQMDKRRIIEIKIFPFERTWEVE